MADPRRYLVTGAAGFIGSHIAERLLDRGERVRILDNLSTGKRENLAVLGDRAEILVGDVRNLGVVLEAVSGVDVIFHHAALSSVSASIADPLTFLEVNVFGPRQDPNSAYAAVIPRFLRSLLTGDPPTIFGDGGQTRDFVHVSDIVIANLLAADTPEVGSGMVMNIGAGVSTSINVILRLAAEICGVDYDPVHLPPRSGDIRDSRADISQAEHLLGYRPAILLREGLALTMASLRATM